MTANPRPQPDALRAQNTRDTDHIIGLINMGVDFGSMSTIRTLIDEIKYLRADMLTIHKTVVTQVFPANQVVSLLENAAELNRRLDVINEIAKHHIPPNAARPPTADSGR